MWSGNSSCSILSVFQKVQTETFPRRSKSTLWKDHEIIFFFFNEAKDKDPSVEWVKYFVQMGTWDLEWEDPAWKAGLWALPTLTLGQVHKTSVHLSCFKTGDNSLCYTVGQWSSETMNVKVLCKLESYLLPLMSTSELTQFFSPPQRATASSLLPPKSRRLIPAVLSTSAAWREGLSEDPEGAWTSPPPPWQRACALSTSPPPSGAGTVAWVMGNVALGHCLAAWLFLHYSGYSFRINKDQRPRLLSQATWVPMLVPPMTGEVTGIRTNSSQYLVSIQIRQPCSEGFICISSGDLHNNLMRSAQLLFSYSRQWN